MTTSEEIAATALARWLESRKGRGLDAAPPELDPDVVEAIYALRPDLAPEPTVTIDEILATLDQAEPLAKWLDDGAGIPDLDDDVAEAVFALQPDRAPGPKVSIDDILGRVTSGPLAAGGETEVAGPEEHLAEVVPFPSRPVSLPEPANVAPPSFAGRPFGQKREPRNARWVPWLVGSGAFGAVAAAALVALAVLPGTMSSPDAQLGAAPAEELASSSPTAAPSGDIAPMLEKTADQPSPVLADPAPMAAAAQGPAKAEAPVVAAKAPATPSAGWWEQQQAPVGGKTGTVAPAEPPPALAPPPAVAFSEASLAAEPTDEVVADLFDGDDENENLDFARDRADEDADAGGLFGGRPERESAEYDDAPVARGGEAPVTTESKRQAKPKATSSYASNQATTVPEEAFGPMPSELPPGFWSLASSTQQQLVENQNAADALAAQGKYVDAGRKIAKNVVSPASVGQWYAARAARWFQQGGRSDLAESVCDQGMAFGAASAELSAACPAPAPQAAPALDAME